MLDLINTIDNNFLFWVHLNLSNVVLDISMPFITDEKNWIFPIALLIFTLGFKSGKKGKLCLVILIISLGLTDAISAHILKPFFERIRPSHLNLDGINLLVSKGGKWSMPSNHAANIFSLATVLSYFYTSFKPSLYLLAIIIAFSRVYVGVHFPGDVIVGGLIGYFIALTVLTFWGKLKLRELKKGRTWILLD
jgi:undecaprenyl-diphosphatase